MPSVQRILDANVNRAREAVRVMEEAARFLLEDAELATATKQFRHDLARQLSKISELAVWRDTVADVGTELKTADEWHRPAARDVVVAAGKRLGEALRVLEEYGKTLEVVGSFVAEIEQLRYRGYELERQLNLAMNAGRGRTQWRLCVLISEAICLGGDWLAVARAAIEGGADCLQLREKALDGLELVRRARHLVALCRPQGVGVMVNDRPDIALLADADGVHLGQSDLPCDEARRLMSGFGRARLIGVSTSTIEQAQTALRSGADYCGVGCIFESTTKQKPHCAGPEYLRQYLRWNKLPHLAIGGITTENIEELVEVGAQGIAVSRGVCGAVDPASVVRQLAESMSKGMVAT